MNFTDLFLQLIVFDIMLKFPDQQEPVTVEVKEVSAGHHVSLVYDFELIAPAVLKRLRLVHVEKLEETLSAYDHELCPRPLRKAYKNEDMN